MPANITFRAHLIGSINDFSDACSMGLIVRPTILVELIVSLSRFKEEGARLIPEVYLCNDINQLLKLLPNHGLIHIGEAQATEDAIKEILKKCAPLAIGGWCIFIEGNDDLFKYGLFRDSLNPLALPIDEILLSTHSVEVKVVRVYQTAGDCVEIRNYRGNYHNIFLSHKKESSPSPTKFLSELVDAISEKVDESQKETIKTFLSKSLHEALSASHGTLVAVSNTSVTPKFLSDGVHLREPIDFAEEVYQVSQNKLQPVVLTSQSSLLKGMLNCDGIVVFSRDARLLSYNCFVSSSMKKVKPSSGGARMRAFETLCKKIGRGIYAAFIQSQDGWNDFRRNKHD